MLNLDYGTKVVYRLYFFVDMIYNILVKREMINLKSLKTKLILYFGVLVLILALSLGYT